MGDNIIKCEICNKEMKSRINGSHLFRAHNISLDEYKKQFPTAFLGKRTLKIQQHTCKICNKTIGSLQQFSLHLQFHNITPEQYFIKFMLNGNVPLCKCGCKNSPSFINIQKGFHKYIAHHAPVWNDGLTKKNDSRINHMYDNRKPWNKGLTKNTSDAVNVVSQKIKQSWNPKNISQRTTSYKENMMKKYGVENGFQLDSVKEKSKNTLLQKYGVEHPQFSNECKFKWKTYIYPSGNTIKYQGYENFGLDLLLSKQYHENEIITDRKYIPKIKYIDFDGKIRRYCADMWIPKDNLLIETKSNFTYILHKENIHYKKIGVISSGYNFQLFVFNDDGTLNNKIHE